MPGNAYLKFTGGSAAEGESKSKTNPGADGWIEIGDWSFDVEAETSFLKGGGASVGKPTPGNFSFSHYYDTSSKALFANIIKGTHFDKLELQMLKQAGGTTLSVYFKIIAESVFVTKLSTKGGEDGAVSQDVELVFKTVQIDYFKQNDDGKLESAPKSFKWNISTLELEAE